MNALPVVWLAVALAAPGPKDPPKAAPSGLVGRWAIESSTLNGNPLPISDLVVTYTADGKSESRVGGKVVQTGTFTFDPKRDPAEIDMTDAAPLSVAWPGIYKLDGDTLTICVSAHQKRPTTFEPAAGSGLIRTVYKRVKKD